MLSLPPLSLYIHIPWCVKKCPYCDFNSHRAEGDLPETEYIRALLADLACDRKYIQGRRLRSIFIGGGTPSLFSPGAYENLLEGIHKIAPFDGGIEITLEANPGTFEQEKFQGFRQAGINRLSVGVQSFNDDFLRALGRIHDASQARRAVEITRRAKFDNVNLDLMFGLPGQAPAAALADLETAVACGLQHISWYQLTIEPNTAFYRHPPALPGEDATADMQEAGQRFLYEHGYARYEISAYARPHRQSAHNLNYWTFGDYLGIGAGAHGKITLPDKGVIMRTRKTHQPHHYLARAATTPTAGQAGTTDAGVKRGPAAERDFTAQTTVIPRHELPMEFMMNAMRLNLGSDKTTFETRTGLPFSLIEDKLRELEGRQLAMVKNGAFAPSDRGQRFLNNMLTAFL